MIVGLDCLSSSLMQALHVAVCRAASVSFPEHLQFSLFSEIDTKGFPFPGHTLMLSESLLSLPLVVLG